MDSKQNIGQEYRIEEAYITKETFGSDEYDVSASVIEITFFEDIEKPYITAAIVLLDDNSLISDVLDFKGTEKLTITISSTVENKSLYSLTRTFVMSEIITSTKTSDRSEVFVISLIDEHAFLDSATKISKSYTGKLEDISSTILISELGLEVDLSFLSKSAQAEIKVIIPYLSPLQAAEWLMARATTVNGSPYWLYSTLYDPRIRISSFDALYSSDPFNKDLPFIYSSALTSSAQDLGPEYQNMLIKEFKADNIENTMIMLNMGAIGSELSSTDVFENRTIVSKHRVGKTLQRLQQNEILPSNSRQSVYDSDKIMIENVNQNLRLDDLNSRILHSLTSHGTYCTYNSYHDTFNSSQVGDKQRNNSIRNLLNKNPIDVTVPGLSLFLGKISVGDMVRLHFLTSNTNINSTSNILDKHKSGDYMITRVRHIFKETIHESIMTVTKINKLQSGNLI